MSLYRFTGNPFVDTGIAGMCAAADVERPEALDRKAVDKAVERLVKILTSPQALEARAKPGDPKKTSAFATSEMSYIFPNGAHANPSNKGKTKDKYNRLIKNLLHSIDESLKVDSICFCCSRKAEIAVIKMDFPLIDSRVNFHPALSGAHQVCAFCALAVQFIPISIMGPIYEGLFWFLSSLDPAIAVTAARRLTLDHMDRCISANQRLSCYNESKRRYSGIVDAVDFLTSNFRVKTGIQSQFNWDLPTRAIFFANCQEDDKKKKRITTISTVEIPCFLFSFFARLHSSLNRSHNQFVDEVLRSSIGEQISEAMLRKQPIIKPCIAWPGTDEHDQPITLRGGWFAHRLYVKEVLKMQGHYIKTVEDVASRILKADDPVSILKKIKTVRSPMDWLLQRVKDGLITREELYILMPPNDYHTGNASLDYIAAATADAIRRKESGEELEPWEDIEPEGKDSEHPIIHLVEHTGDTVFNSAYDPKKLLNHLCTARNVYNIRRAWLRALEGGAIGWVEFKALIPPEDGKTAYSVRDYIIAYLCDRLKGSTDADELQEMEIISAQDQINEEDEEWRTL